MFLRDASALSLNRWLRSRIDAGIVRCAKYSGAPTIMVGTSGAIREWRRWVGSALHQNDIPPAAL